MVDFGPRGTSLNQDLLNIDLRGEDLRGADLRRTQHLALAELVTLEDGYWKPLAAWDQDTRFPRELQEILLLMNLLNPGNLTDHTWWESAIERGRRARRFPLDKSVPGILETMSDRWSDG